MRRTSSSSTKSATVGSRRPPPPRSSSSRGRYDGGGGSSRGGRHDGIGANHSNDRGRNNPSSDPNTAAAVDDDEPPLVVSTAFSEGTTLAFACYDERRNEIQLESHRAHGHDTISIVESYLQSSRPNLMVVPGKIAGNAPLLDCLTTAPPGQDVDDATMMQAGEGGKDHPPHGRGRGDSNANSNGANNGNSGRTNDNNGGSSRQQQPPQDRGRRPQQPPPQQQQPPQPPAKIPYRILKSAAFDLRTCRALILHKLRVLSLLRPPRCGTGTGDAATAAGTFHSSAMGGVGYGRGDDDGRHFHHGPPQRPHHRQHAPSSYHALASLIDFDCTATIRALGSLLSYLQSTLFRLEDGRTVTVSTMRNGCSSGGGGGVGSGGSNERNNGNKYMRIDDDTLKALRVFHTEHHPLMASRGTGGGGGGKRGGGGGGSNHSKEGFSLFSLLDRTKSRGGRMKLREWMLKPSLDAKVLRRRHDGIDLFLGSTAAAAACAGGDAGAAAAASSSSSSSSSVPVLLELLGRIGPIDGVLLRMQRCTSKPPDFLVLSKTLASAVAICETLLVAAGELRKGCGNSNDDAAVGRGDTMEVEAEHLGGGASNDADLSSSSLTAARLRRSVVFLEDILHRCSVPVLRELHGRVTSVVDEEATAEARGGYVAVHYGFHEGLDAAKEAFENLDETLSAVGSDVLNQHPELEQLKVVFLPQVGFLICLDKRQHSHNIATNEFPDLPPDFEFTFIQDDDAYFKSPDMRRLDVEIGDLDAYIKDTESMIVSELEEDILECETELRSTFGALSELDCILSFASCAADLNFVRPEIVEARRGGDDGGGECKIRIENGRHPLQELIIDDEFIANDTDVDGNNRVNVVTGPNFSGKSCYTRQVGILVYLAHIGCFLPCDRARISITDQILARISSVETCAVPQSTFQLDLTQMATILRRSTPWTLVLIDEFGKGTAPASGISVLTSALKKLSANKCMVICTTHFLEIFSLGLLQDGRDGIRVLQMAVHIPKDGDDSAVPLFKLETGVANSSAGLVCAKMAGVKSCVVSRAKDILSALKEGRPVRPVAASMNSNLTLQPGTKATLRLFLGVDSWANASEEELAML